jgi:thiol-disulfide isomerase/thioredoxin
MKPVFLVFKCLLVNALIIMATNAAAQVQYEILQDNKNSDIKILKGLINKSIIENDTAAFKWYASNQKKYQPDTAAIGNMQRTKNKVQYVLFGGTWCEDTQFILPKFFALQEKSGVPDANITFWGVDRAKKTMGNIATAFGITNVPTIIVMKDGKEIGRVVEYGKTGKWDKELASILLK